MPNKSKKTYSEIDHIREDLDSLKNNVVELTRHMKKMAMPKLHIYAKVCWNAWNAYKSR